VHPPDLPPTVWPCGLRLSGVRPAHILSLRTVAILRKLIQAQWSARGRELSGTIEGRIALLMNGALLPCANANVYLLLKPLDMDGVKQKAVQEGEFNPLLAHMALEYVITSAHTQSRAAYARVKTNAKGQFVFPDLPGDRWYYVTAQALTGPMLASWQLAVYLYPKERVQVFLTNANAVLPIHTKSETEIQQ
jgi:hypothetical protein